MRTPRKVLTHVGISVLLVSLAAMAFSKKMQAQGASAASPQSSRDSNKQPLRFETVSIHPHKDDGDDSSTRKMLPGGRLVVTNTPVLRLIRVAFMTEDSLVTGGPSWIRDEPYDIVATTEGRVEVNTPEQFQQLLLSLLEDRFQLKCHKVQREVPVFWLELDKAGRLGPGLRPAAPGGNPSMSSNGGTVRIMKVTNSSMADIAGGLRRVAGRPVEDHTGIPGNFDLEFKWSPDETQDATEPSLPAALKEQLGLKLVPAKGTEETIAIDSISRPTPN